MASSAPNNRTVAVDRRRMPVDIGVVFVALAGTHRYHEWWPPEWDARALSRHGGVGGRWAFNGPIGRQVCQIVEASPGRLVEFHFHDGPVRGVGRWGLARQVDQTEITLAVDLVPVTPIHRFISQMRDQSQLQHRVARRLFDCLARRTGAVAEAAPAAPVRIPIVV
jgi:hypothetical protein